MEQYKFRLTIILALLVVVVLTACSNATTKDDFTKQSIATAYHVSIEDGQTTVKTGGMGFIFLEGEHHNIKAGNTYRFTWGVRDGYSFITYELIRSSID